MFTFSFYLLTKDIKEKMANLLPCQVQKRKSQNFLTIGLGDKNANNSGDFEYIANNLSLDGH